MNTSSQNGNGLSSSPSNDLVPEVEYLEGIPHMDATWRRKRRMRSQSASQAVGGSDAGRSATNSKKTEVSRPPIGSANSAQWETTGRAGDLNIASPALGVPRISIDSANDAGSGFSTNLGPRPIEPAPTVSKTSQGRVGWSRDELEAFLINFVVEQTGYPPEIVELDADLEADLGIDSIKKAQLFGELREHFDITPSDTLSLDDFPTLAHVRDYLQSSTENSGHVSAQSTRSHLEMSSSPITTGQRANASRPETSPAYDTTSSSNGNSVQERAPTPALSASPTATSGTSLSCEEFEAFLVNFVVEQTGYPPEIVEMDADLEADLGIDSIKKAQLFGELREHFDITPSDTLSLDDFPTLAHVRDYLQLDSSTATPAATSRAPTPAAEPEPLSSPDHSPALPTSSPSGGSGLGRAELEAFLVNFVVEQTGYPPDIVEMDADLEADLGIDSIKKAQLFGELREHFDITPSDTLSLDDFPTLAHVRDYLLLASC